MGAHIAHWSDEEQMWAVTLDECGVRRGLCDDCHDARRTNAYCELCKKCTWTKSGKRRAETSGAGFPSGQDTFCRPEDMKRIDQYPTANNISSPETNPNATTTNTPAGPESPDDLPKVTPVVNPHDPTVNADTTSDKPSGKDLSKKPWSELTKELYDMPWNELKKFAEEHGMKPDHLKHRHGGNKNGFVRDIMAHLRTQIHDNNGEGN